jgi:hypothetical protein
MLCREAHYFGSRSAGGLATNEEGEQMTPLAYLFLGISIGVVLVLVLIAILKPRGQGDFEQHHAEILASWEEGHAIMRENGNAIERIAVCLEQWDRG